MSRRFTFVTLALTALIAFLVGAIVAGGFIGLGAMYYVVVASDASLGFAAQRVLGGLVFSLGLILVVIAGAELFTGNNLLVMAWADQRITTLELLRNWLVVYLANAVGAAGLALIVYLSGHAEMNGGAIGQQYLKIAMAKTSLPFAEAFFRGVLCNLLENAARHTPAGTVVRLRAERSGEEIVVSVEDFGPGLPEADLEKLFAKFSRAGGEIGRAHV